MFKEIYIILFPRPSRNSEISWSKTPGGWSIFDFRVPTPNWGWVKMYNQEPPQSGQLPGRVQWLHTAILNMHTSFHSQWGNDWCFWIVVGFSGRVPRATYKSTQLFNGSRAWQPNDAPDPEIFQRTKRNLMVRRWPRIKSPLMLCGFFLPFTQNAGWHFASASTLECHFAKNSSSCPANATAEVASRIPFFRVSGAWQPNGAALVGIYGSNTAHCSVRNEDCKRW